MKSGVGGRRQGLRQIAIRSVASSELGRGPREILLRRDQVEVREACRASEVAGRHAVQQVTARRAVRPFSEARSRIGLRVEVDEQDAFARLGQAGGD